MTQSEITALTICGSFLMCAAGYCLLVRAVVLSNRNDREAEKHKYAVEMMKAELARMQKGDVK